jgi:hypothetical protein
MPFGLSSHDASSEVGFRFDVDDTAVRGEPGHDTPVEDGDECGLIPRVD